MASSIRVAGLALRYLTPLLLIAGGAAIAAALIFAKQEPEKSERPKKALPVELFAPIAERQEPTLEAFGTVEPKRTVVLRPVATGPVTFVHDDLLAGGRVDGGETIVGIDVRDFELAVATASAAVITAQANLDVELGNASVALREFELLGNSIEVDETSKKLALREPFVAQRRAELKTAETRVEQAELDLARASITCPFDAVVLSENVEVGTMLGAGAEIATLVDRSVFLVEVSVLQSKLTSIDLSERVTHVHAGGDAVYKGRIARILGEVDREGRMARLQVEIENPLEEEALPPLLLGSYVRVELPLKPIAQAHAIPRAALREGDVVWLMRAGKLAIEGVEVALKRRDDVLVTSGLSDGDLVVTSAIGVPLPGMELRDANVPLPSEKAREEPADPPSGEPALEQDRKPETPAPKAQPVSGTADPSIEDSTKRDSANGDSGQ